MKTYVAVMFPYPSGAGMHLGHCYNYAIMDSYCRWLRYKGQEVFQPFGYDAFGLPAENYAKQVGGDPKEITYRNIENFRKQMQRMNTQYEEKLVTCDPSYYKWTQWLFEQLYRNGFAYKKDALVNYCPKCETVLANEQVKEEHCDRCESKVERKMLNQWFFKITAYRDRLIKNLVKIDYPESTIKQQRRWLANQEDWCVSRQRKWGCPIPNVGLGEETDTLDTFVDSSFYYLRYLTDSTTEFLPKDAYKQVDLYVGGPEHACMHLIYARFIHMFLYDIGIVPVEEPFKRVIHQGMITKDGAKMSKSKGNAVDPDNYDSDELRMFSMFLGPYFEGGDWNDKGIVGLKRFFARMQFWLDALGEDELDVSEFEKTVDGYVMNFKFNKVVSSFMELYNKNKHLKLSYECSQKLTEILRVFAPGF
jgi:leucyl-tRNA synthetase